MSRAGREAGRVQRELTIGTVKDLVVGSGPAFTERGTHALRGVPGTWSIFAVA